MPIQSTKIFLGSTPIPFYYIGDIQVGANPASINPIPTNGLIYVFDATNPLSYPGSGSVWYDISPNRVFAAPFSSSTFPTWNVTNKEFTFNGTNNALMAPISASISTGSIITDFTQIMWVNLGNTSGDSRGIVNLQRGTSGGTDFDSITYDDTNERWRLIAENNSRNVTSVQTETVLNSYLMVAATRASGSNSFRILRNGANVIATGSYTPLTYTAVASNNVYTSIGNRLYNTGIPAWASDGWITASISSVILYNRVLSDDEINSIYSVGRTGIQLS